MEYIVNEKRDTMYISYEIIDEKDFFEVGYKVLRSQEKNGFIKCTKVLHNGKVRLIYNTSNYKNLEDFIYNTTTQNVVKVIEQLFKVIRNVKENGFMEYKNINSSINTIYVDSNNLNIKLIYLPLNNRNGISEKFFIEELKNNIKSVLLNSNHSRTELLKYRNKIQESEFDILEVFEDREYTRNRKLINNTNIFSVEKDNFIDGIQLVSIDKKGFSIVVASNSFIIGSSGNLSQGVINFNKAISRKHCKIIEKNNRYFIIDIGSSNGTYVNERKLIKDEEKEIKIGDYIKIANSEFIVEMK